jgi:hypothetical protein
MNLSSIAAVRMNSDDVTFEQWKLACGQRSFRCTHLPTGVSVTATTVESKPVFQILGELQQRLSEEVEAHLAKRNP